MKQCLVCAALCDGDDHTCPKCGSQDWAPAESSQDPDTDPTPPKKPARRGR